MSKRKRTGCLPFSLRTGCISGILLIVATLITGVALVWGFRSVLDPVGNKANELMNAIKDGNAAAAYALMSNDFQSRVTADQFPALLSDMAAPTDWTFSSFSVNGTYGRVLGSVVFAGQRYNLTINLIYEGGGWAISGFNLGVRDPIGQLPLPPTPRP